MPNPLSPSKFDHHRDCCRNYPACGRRCSLRSKSSAPASSDPVKLPKSKAYPSQTVMGLNLDGLGELEREARRRKRAANDTRVTKSNNQTPFVADGSSEGNRLVHGFTQLLKSPSSSAEQLLRTPQSTGALERCSNCGSPAGTRLPTKFPKSSRTQRSLTFKDDEVMRDASQSSSIEVVKLSPTLEKYLLAKGSSSSSSPSNDFYFATPATPPIITPERLNKLNHFGLGVDATRISGEFEISGSPLAPLTPPAPPTAEVDEKLPLPGPEPPLTVSLAGLPTPGRKRRSVPAAKSLDLGCGGRRKWERPFTRLSTGDRPLYDRLVIIREKSPGAPTKEALGTDIVSLLVQTGDYQIILANILSYVTEDDLCSMCCVSHPWQRGVFGDFEASHRRKTFLKLKRLWIHSPDNENSRMLRGYNRSPATIRPRTIAELSVELDRATHGHASISGAAAPGAVSRRHSLTPANNVPRSPVRGAHTLPRAQTESESRLMLYFEEGKKLRSGERFARCPNCNSPAIVTPGKVMAECTRETCRFSFCPHCLVGSPRRCCRTQSAGNDETAPTSPQKAILSPLRPWGSAPSIGSRKSKRNLRRLMDK